MKNPLLYLISKLWHYSRGNRPKVVLYAALSALANLLLALEPMVVGLFLNTLQRQGLNTQNVWYLFFLIGLLILIEIGFWGLHGPSRVMENKNAFYIRTQYKNYLLQGTMALPIEWHTDHHSGDTIDKIEKGTEALFNFSGRSFEVIQGLITMLTAFAAMFVFNGLAGITALVLSLTAFYLLTLFDKRLVPGYDTVNHMENTISAKVFDALSNVTTIVILRVEALVLKTINTYIQKPYKQFGINVNINEWKWFVASIMGRMTVIIVMCVYLFYQAKKGSVLVGTIYVLYGYANQVRDTFFRFAYMYNDIVRYRASVSNTEELSNDFKEAATHSMGLPEKWSAIAIHNLSFSYHTEEGADLNLEDICLEMKKGERIALIGESGGGKSTFLKVLRDLYRPKSMSLLVNRKTVANGFGVISNSISLVPQDPELFATTIRENITLGVEYTDDYINFFTDMACFSDVVCRLPKGLESSIVEKGVNLSGGEKQRLALSRGLLASVDKEIILLDEPTSSVDFQNELQIYQNIFAAFPDKTIVSSIHRLHLLSLFDSIYLFREGKITAAGSLDELKINSADFSELWEKYILSRDAPSRAFDQAI